MAKGQSVLRRFIGEGKRELVSEIVHELGYAVVPLGWSALTAAFSYLQGLPLAYGSAAASVAFAMAGVGTYQFHNVVYQRSPKGKLRFGGLLLATVREGDRQSLINSVQVGVHLNSISMFPMRAALESITTILGGRIVTKKNPFPTINIDAAAGGYFYDYAIDINGLDLSKVINGELHFDIAYGRGHSLNYHLVGKYQLNLKMRSTEIVDYFTWDQI